MRKPLPQDDLQFIVEQTADVWAAFDGARLFVTGGTGFIGSWLLEAIQHANRVTSSHVEVVTLSRNAAKAREYAPHLFDDGSVTLIEGDVTTFEADVGRIDFCIHAATDVADTKKAADALRMFDTGVAGTRRVLDFARKSGVARLLLTSSGAVYGTQPPSVEKMPESYMGAPDPLDPATAYGQGKRAAEWLAATYAREGDLQVAIARIYALVGPGIPLDGPFAAGNFIRDAIAGRAISMKGDGRPLRSYLYMADTCIWLFHMLLHAENGQAYNVGSEDALSIAALAKTIERLCGSRDSGLPSAARNDSDAPRYVPDTSKARRSLGLAQYTGLETALSKTINWNRTAVTQ